MSEHLTGKRVLILGAETDVGRAVTAAVAEAGASVAAVAATSDADAAFAVQRLARRLSSGERKAIAQAIDGTNEAAVRVMVRQVSKELGGLDAVVYFAPPVDRDQSAIRMFEEFAVEPSLKHASANFLEWMITSQHILTFAEKEFDRRGGGTFVAVPPPGGVIKDLPAFVVTLDTRGKPMEGIAAEVVRAIAGEADSG
jgi:NAD(P)-dependent dehydrogenase (short-subunit alcohol dehydrogenase family)